MYLSIFQLWPSFSPLLVHKNASFLEIGQFEMYSQTDRIPKMKHFCGLEVEKMKAKVEILINTL